MRDLILLHDPQAIRDKLNSLWRTDCVRKAALTPGHWVFNLVEAYAAKPRIMFIMSEPDIEKSHFTSSFNCLAIREYESAGINDVYYIHELSHVTTMVHKKYSDHNEWSDHKCDNEMYATLSSDCLIYFMLPELRSETFNWEIWVDRFYYEKISISDQPGETNHQFYNRDPAAFAEKLRVLKRGVLEVEDTSTLDPLEEDNYVYELDNRKWCDMWLPHYEELEALLTSFEQELTVDKEKAIQHLSTVLMEKDSVPWRDMAWTWSEYYKEKQHIYTKNRMVLLERYRIILIEEEQKKLKLKQ